MDQGRPCLSIVSLVVDLSVVRMLKITISYCLIYFQLVAQSLVRVMQTHCQFFLTTSEVFVQFAKVCSLEDLANGASSVENINSTSPNVTPQAVEQQYKKLAETHPQDLSPRSTDIIKSGQNVDSPSRLRKHISSFFSKKLGGGKSGAGPGDIASQSYFYVQTPKSNANLEAAGPSDSVTEGAVKHDTQEVGESAGQSSSELGTGAGPHGAVVGEPARAGNKTKNQTSARPMGDRTGIAGTILTQIINLKVLYVPQ